jgi:hypothetical protein
MVKTWVDLDVLTAADMNTYLAQTQIGTYTPTLANCAVGTGGSASNTADYVYVGDPASGGEGIMFIQGSIVLGTSGASMGTGPTATLPTGFTQNIPAATAVYRQGGCSMEAGASGTVQGLVQWSSTTAVAFVVMGSASTYVGTATITSAVPGTWAAGNLIRWWYTANVSRT